MCCLKSGTAEILFENIANALRCLCWKVVLMLRICLLIYSLGFIKAQKEKSILKSLISFCDQVYRNIIKHVSTMWLSLETAVTQTLQLY